MIEPLTLGVIAAALLGKALERAEDKVLDGGEGVLRRLLDYIRGNPPDRREEGAALQRFEAAPSGPAQTRELARSIDARAALDADFREQLEALLSEARAAGLDVDAIGQTAIGDQNVQLNEVSGSEVNVNFGAPPEPPSR